MTEDRSMTSCLRVFEAPTAGDIYINNSTLAYGMVCNFLPLCVRPQLLLPNGLRISALERGRDTGERVWLFVACRAGIAMLDAVKVDPPRPFHTCLYRAVALIDALTLPF